VATTTTHDLPTVAGWWTGEDIRTRRALGLATPGDEEEREKDRERLWRAFVESGTAHPPRPADDEPEAVVDGALAYAAQSPSSLMLAPIEDLLGLVEQPNLPGTVDEHPNWRRRLAAPASELFATTNAERRVKLIGRCRR
jgi:4-alpha-glucanotransferase